MTDEVVSQLSKTIRGNVITPASGSGKRTSEVSPGELEGRKLVAKLSEFVADSDLSIYRIAQLMGVSGMTLNTWVSGAAKPRRDKLLEIRSFLDLHGPQCLPGF